VPLSAKSALKCAKRGLPRGLTALPRGETSLVRRLGSGRRAGSPSEPRALRTNWQKWLRAPEPMIERSRMIERSIAGATPCSLRSSAHASSHQTQKSATTGSHCLSSRSTSSDDSRPGPRVPARGPRRSQLAHSVRGPVDAEGWARSPPAGAVLSPGERAALGAVGAGTALLSVSLLGSRASRAEP
jgi:hypothetical protein